MEKPTRDMWLATHGQHGDFNCPSCHIGIDVEEWPNTEYGNPKDGKYTVACPVCGTMFYVVVETRTTYKVVS